MIIYTRPDGGARMSGGNRRREVPGARGERKSVGGTAQLRETGVNFRSFLRDESKDATRILPHPAGRPTKLDWASPPSTSLDPSRDRRRASAMALGRRRGRRATGSVSIFMLQIFTTGGDGAVALLRRGWGCPPTSACSRVPLLGGKHAHEVGEKKCRLGCSQRFDT